MNYVNALVHKVTMNAPWYATQVGRAVSIRRKETDEEINRFEPPRSWGEYWAWNLCAEGICFTRTQRSGKPKSQRRNP